MNAAGPRIIASLVCGTLFGFGLAVSGMVDPTRVRGFLDVKGAWDPTLAFVLAGAVTVASVGFRIVARRAAPVFAQRFETPSTRRIDTPLVVGATLFGVGWGLSGYCPGPAVASLTYVGAPAMVFIAAMLVGMFTFKMWKACPGAPRSALVVEERSR